MASEVEANLARRQHSALLRGLGAHSVAVAEIKRKGEKTFAVIAYFETKPASVPATLQIKRSKRIVEVPLIARVMEKFRLE